MGRASWAWLLIPLSLVTLASLAAGALIRGSLQEGKSFWVIRPVVYIAQDQNLGMARAQALPLTALALLLAIFALWVMRSRIPNAPPILELTVGFASGGALANAIEIVTVGSVTDFVGIHAAGAIYSAGDIALALALAVAPVSVFQVAATRRGLRSGLRAGAAVYLVVAAVSVTSPGTRALAAMATAAVVVALGVLLARSRRFGSPNGLPPR